MKKKALIISDDLFINYSYDKGMFNKKDNKILSKLSQKFEYDNISSLNLDSYKAINYIKEFVKHYNYSHCIVSLKEFKGFDNTIEELEKLGIKIIIIAAPNTSDECVNKLINFSNDKNVDYIIYDDVVKEHNLNKINSMILNLCA